MTPHTARKPFGRPSRDRSPPAAPRRAAAPGGDINRTIADAVAGLQYDLIDIERAPRGLLRVTIDRRAGQTYDGDSGEFITVVDCERVTRQLQYALEVEGADYARLEVSSPGLDRPLKTAADYQRFSGQEINLTLKMPFEGRKHWRGVLGAAGDGWQLQLSDDKAGRQLGFTLDEVREARLVPVLNFKGRKSAAPEAAAATENDGGKTE